MLPASAAALYGGCAFNDAAAMSATVSRLEGDLARAKAALTERLATEDIQLRQRRDLDAEVTRLHAEVGQQYAVCTKLTQRCVTWQPGEQLQRLAKQVSIGAFVARQTRSYELTWGADRVCNTSYTTAQHSSWLYQ
jgi:hypothetical protein